MISDKKNIIFHISVYAKYRKDSAMGKGTYRVKNDIPSEEEILLENIKNKDGNEKSMLKNRKVKAFASDAIVFFEKFGYNPNTTRKDSIIEKRVKNSKARIAIYVALILLVIAIVVLKFVFPISFH